MSRATLHLCGGTAWEIELDGQQVDVGDQCTAHTDCYRVTLQDGSEGFFSRHELVQG